MKILNHPISEALKANPSTVEYPVMEYFYSLQGEGFNTGQPCFFIRLGGCDVGCHWCDVKESWDAEVHPKMTIQALLDLAKQHPAKNIVITGGEPCMYNLEPITTLFKKNGFTLWLETSGAYPVHGSFDWICVSPKKTRPAIKEALDVASELKVVIYNKDDFKWAESHQSLVSSDCILFLQPEWSKKEKVQPLIVEYIKQNPAWRLSLQTHKYLDIR